MDKPLISVITIVKDDPQGLIRTARSVEAQLGLVDPGRVEWVVADGSTQSNATQQAIAGFGHRVGWTESRPDGGIYPAFNKALDHATGDFVMFMNGGDEFAADDVLATLVKAIGENPETDFIYGDFTYQDMPRRATPLEDSATRMPTCHQAMVYRNGPLRYQEKYKINGDYCYTHEYLQQVHAPLYIPKPLARFEGGGVSETCYVKNAIEAFDVRANAGVPLATNIGRCALTVASGLLRSALSPALYDFVRGGYDMLLPHVKPAPSPVEAAKTALSR